MGKRQNRVVQILLLGNHAMSAEKNANSPSRDTKNTERTRSVNFNNLIYVNCTREQKKDLFYAYELLPVENQINK